MRNYKLLFLFLTILIVSCSSDNDNLSTKKNVDKLYKKSIEFTEDTITGITEYFYNEDAKIDSISIEYIGELKECYKVSYSDKRIINITVSTNYKDSKWNEFINYNHISFSKNLITLESEKFNEIIEIYHTEKYIDSTKQYNSEYPENVSDQVFTRNSKNQLISSTDGRYRFEYSNFDSNKKLDPYGGVIEYELGHILDIFGLIVTKDNPLTGYYDFNETGTYPAYFEYDEQGYVVKVFYDETNSNKDYVIHEYIEK
ncbi:hypothetical protein [Zunongwangia sp.]|uniref:hypothetical protein n=1 Tax=Zunongwangia sp. TaxID=1965325 RepID=UPI003AA8DD64